MTDTYKAWLHQVTTGHGAMILGPSLLALVSGTMSWDVALPLIAAGLLGLIWPEAARGELGKIAAIDVDAVIAAYKAGLAHAGTDGSAATSGEVASPGAGGMLGCAALVATGLSLSGCVETGDPVGHRNTSGLDQPAYIHPYAMR